MLFLVFVIRSVRVLTASKLSMLLVYEIFVRFESNICGSSFGESVVAVVGVFVLDSLLDSPDAILSSYESSNCLINDRNTCLNM